MRTMTIELKWVPRKGTGCLDLCTDSDVRVGSVYRVKPRLWAVEVAGRTEFRGDCNTRKKAIRRVEETLGIPEEKA